MNRPYLTKSFDARAHAIDLVELAKQHSGRQCGICSLCCKLLPVDKPPELVKPGNVWCKDCSPGHGCKIYDDRPNVCASFACRWLVDAELDDSWRPTISRIVIHDVLDDDGAPVLNFAVDPATPYRWRERHYFETIRRVAIRGLNATGIETQFRTVVTVADKKLLVLPKSTVDITGKTVVLANTGGPDDWRVVPFETAAKAKLFAAGIEGARQYLAGLPVEQREAALGELLAHLGRPR